MITNRSIIWRHMVRITVGITDNIVNLFENSKDAVENIADSV